MKSWEFYDCTKHKDFGDWIIKTDVYVAGLWFLVWKGIVTVTYYTLGCLSVMVVSYFVFWSSSWVSSKQMGRDILFQVTNGNLILLFFTTSKFN